MSIYDLGVGIAATVGDPGAIAGVEHRFKGGDQAAWRNDHFNCLSVALMHIRLAIGDDEEVAIIKARAEWYSEPIGRPHGLRCVAKASLILGGVAGVSEAFSHGGHLARQRTEHVKIGRFLPERYFSGAQCAHP